MSEDSVVLTYFYRTPHLLSVSLNGNPELFYNLHIGNTVCGISDIEHNIL